MITPLSLNHRRNLRLNRCRCVAPMTILIVVSSLSRLRRKQRPSTLPLRTVIFGGGREQDPLMVGYSLAMVDASATTRTPRPSIVSIRIATRLTPDK